MERTLSFVTSNFPRTYQVFCPGGGRGPEKVEHHLLNWTPNVISGVGLSDSGGQTGGLVEEGYPAAGDAISRMENHVRNLTHRKWFRRASKDAPIYGNRRLMTDMLVSLIEDEEIGTFSNAIKYMEGEMKDYFGRVVPVFDRYSPLEIEFNNGDRRIGEHYIDEMTLEQAPVKNIRFVDNSLPINREYTHLIRTAHGILLPPGTTHGSLAPALLPENVREAINETGVPVVFYGNSMNTLATHGWSMEDHIKFFVEYLGINITHAIFPRMLLDLPPLYREQGIDRVVPLNDNEVMAQKKACERYVENVEIRDDLTTLVPYSDNQGSRDVIEHVGEVAAARFIEILDEHYERPRNGFKKNTSPATLVAA